MTKLRCFKVGANLNSKIVLCILKLGIAIGQSRVRQRGRAAERSRKEGKKLKEERKKKVKKKKETKGD